MEVSGSWGRMGDERHHSGWSRYQGAQSGGSLLTSREIFQYSNQYICTGSYQLNFNLARWPKGHCWDPQSLQAEGCPVGQGCATGRCSLWTCKAGTRWDADNYRAGASVSEQTPMPCSLRSHPEGKHCPWARTGDPQSS